MKLPMPVGSRLNSLAGPANVRPGLANVACEEPCGGDTLALELVNGLKLTPLLGA